MSVFSGLNDARTAQGGQYFAPGQYVVEVRKFSQTKSKSRGDCPVIAIEVAITGVEVAYEADGAFKASNKVGEAVSQVIVFDGAHRDTKLSNLKNFCAAALGIADPDGEEGKGVDFEAAAAKFAAGTGESLRGMRLGVAVGKTMTKANKPFCPIRWRAVA